MDITDTRAPRISVRRLFETNRVWHHSWILQSLQICFKGIVHAKIISLLLIQSYLITSGDEEYSTSILSISFVIFLLFLELDRQM